MNDRIEIRCPQCATLLRVKAKSIDRKIACPKCSHAFVVSVAASDLSLPSSSDDELVTSTLVSSDLNVAATARKSKRSANEFADDEDSDLVPSVPAKIQDAPPVPDLAESSFAEFRISEDEQQSASQFAPPKPQRSRRQRRQELEELDASSMRNMASGAFLTILPLLATVLPLCGLQLRRLRAAGDEAPLYAMIPGLVGAIMIGYARRYFPDAWGYGGAAAVFVLVTGIGGTWLTRGANQGDQYADVQEINGVPYSVHTPRTASTNSTTQSNSATQTNRNAIDPQKLAADREQMLCEMEAKRKELEDMGDRMASSIRESKRHAAEATSRLNSEASRLERDHSNFSQGLNEAFMEGVREGFFDAKRNRTVDDSDRNSSKSSDFDSYERSKLWMTGTGRFDPRLSKQGSNRQVNLVAFSSDDNDPLKTAKANTELAFDSNFWDQRECVNAVGGPPHDKRVTRYLFDLRDGFAGVRFKNGALIPAGPGAEDNPFDDSSSAPSGFQCVGVNLAFEREHVVGAQALYVSSEANKWKEEELRSARWIGRRTDDQWTSINSTVPKGCFIICEADSNRVQCWSWIVEK